MSLANGNEVAHVAEWEFAGVSYSVHIERGEAPGHLIILALGPARQYRSVVLEPDAMDQVLTGVLLARDPCARSETAECLLQLGDVLLH